MKNLSRLKRLKRGLDFDFEELAGMIRVSKKEKEFATTLHKDIKIPIGRAKARLGLMYEELVNLEDNLFIQ